MAEIKVLNGFYPKKDGKLISIAYIDPQYNSITKDFFKNQGKKYNMNFLIPPKGSNNPNAIRTAVYGWFMTYRGNETLERYIKPCLVELNKIANSGASNESNNDNISAIKTEIIKSTDEVVNAIDSNKVKPSDETMAAFDAAKLKRDLIAFKETLVNALDADEFKKMIEPLIKFRNAQGHQFSLINTILIYIQDKDAKLVKSKGRWLNFNRIVKRDAPAIGLWVPVGQNLFDSKEERRRIIKNFLDSKGVKTIDELKPGDREELSVELNIKKTPTYTIAPFYDVRHTIQKSGTEDLIGDPDVEIPWSDDSGEETEQVGIMIDGIVNMIKGSGIKLGSVSDMGGALGVSKSGAIDVLDKAKRNIGFFNTLCHEYAHELLHQKYLKNKNVTEYGSFFVGTAQGRAIVEQQAEIAAWIVCKMFDYDLQTSINYSGIWGLNAKTAVRVFDTVINVSQYIANGIDRYISSLNESKQSNRFRNMTGYDLAKMLGMGKKYAIGMKMIQQEEDSNVFESIVNRIVSNILG